MLMVYIDETGDPTGDPSHGGSREYALGAVLVSDTAWTAAFDQMITLRRALSKGTIGLPMRAEVKASNLVRNEGWFKGRGLSPSQRQYIYRKHLQLLNSASMQCFSSWVDKRAFAARGQLGLVRETVWRNLFQRLQKTFPNDPVLIIHDEGEEATIRKYARRARRFLYAGTPSGTAIRMNFQNLVDDPVSRVSDESYMVQLADLVAYSAAKAMIPGGARAKRICPPSMWNHAGASRLAIVNSYARSIDPTLPVAVVTQK
jgi:hypothetical protein